MSTKLISFLTKKIVQDYGFTCQHEDLRVIYAASYMLGMLFGSFFIGQISDRYGRMPALMLGLILVYKSILFFKIFLCSGFLCYFPIKKSMNFKKKKTN